MNQKTDNDTNGTKNVSEFSPSFIKLIIALTVFTLVLTFFSGKIYPYVLDFPEVFKGGLILPWLGAMGLTIIQGINEFNGQIFLFGTQSKIYLLVSILLIGIVFPTLMMFGLKNSSQKKNSSSEEKKYVFYPHSVQVILSGIILISIFVSSIIHFYVASKISENMKRNIAIEDNRDNIVSELIDLSNEARQFAILPHELGGGNGSFVLSSKDSKEKKYIELNNLKSFALVKEANYFLAPYKSDSLMTIVAVSKTRCSNPNFSNYNGQKGFVQVVANISKNSASTRVESSSRFNNAEGD
ncbi:MAG: hypothetical protein WC727_10805 [Ignavibacteriaceae bacterium]|jgi:hypothetical protein